MTITLVGLKSLAVVISILMTIGGLFYKLFSGYKKLEYDVANNKGKIDRNQELITQSIKDMAMHMKELGEYIKENTSNLTKLNTDMVLIKQDLKYNFERDKETRQKIEQITNGPK